MALDNKTRFHGEENKEDSNDNRGTYKPTHKVNNTTKRRCVFQQAIAFSVLMLHKNAKIVNDFHIILMTNI